MGAAPEILEVETIVRQGLCIGCGLCESIAGAHNLRMTMNGEGGERPQLIGAVDETALRIINEVCPGMHCEGYRADPGGADRAVRADRNDRNDRNNRDASERRTAGGTDDDPPAEVHVVWGPTRWMGVGHAADPQVRFHASSGGALSALALYLLESKRVDMVLHVAASREHPARSEAHLSFDAAQVMEGAGSRYGPAAPLRDFRAVLDRGRRFAFIGKPCDVSAIRNYARHDPRVDRLLAYTLNFYCGGASEFGKTLDYVRKSGLEERDVASLRYRGDGCPGAMVVGARDGRAFSYGYNEMWDDESRWQLQFRCKICPDSLGDLADISVADLWPGGRPEDESAGFNGFIARTHRGTRLLRAAIEDGAIRITEPLTFAALERAQEAQALRKQAISSRLAALRNAGIPVPRFSNLRLEEAAALSAPAARRANYDGMRERLARGDNREDPARDERGSAVR